MVGNPLQIAALANDDLRVSYRLASLGRVAPEDRENPMSEPRTSVGPGDPSSEYVPLSGTGVGARQGILLVTITEAKTGAVVWQATSEGIASSTASAVSAVTRGTQAALEKVPAASKRAP